MGTLDTFVSTKEIVIDRPKGSVHPRYADYVYPLDYGYFKGTVSGDGKEIDVWLGSEDKKHATAIVITLDANKGDIEPKLLLGGSKSEIDEVLKCHSRGEMTAALFER